MRRGNNIFLALLALCASGCANTRIGRAQALGAGGSAASGKLSDAHVAIGTSFADDRKAEDIQDALLDIASSPPNPDFVQVTKSLAARAAVAARLKTAYASFAALANYDAKGEFEAAASGLIDAVNAAGIVAKLTDKVPEGVGKVGGELIRLDQLRRLRDASAAIRTALTTYHIILEKDGPAFVSIERHAISGHYNIVGLMWRKGLLSASTLVAGLQPEDGLALTGKPEDYVAGKPIADALVKGELQRRERAQQAAAAEVEQQQEAVVQQLIAQHALFEQGKPLDFAGLQAALDELTAALAIIAPAKD